MKGEKNRKKKRCRTRWVERHEAFEVFTNLFMPILCLEAISLGPPAEWNRESRADAQSLQLAISQFSFVVGLQATQAVLAFTKDLRVKLQGRYVDIACAYCEIEGVKCTR